MVLMGATYGCYIHVYMLCICILIVYMGAIYVCAICMYIDGVYVYCAMGAIHTCIY